jgi:hypothetical protein
LVVAEDEGRGAGGGRVLEGVTRCALRSVGTDADRILDLARLDQRLGDEEALGPCLAGELEVGDVDFWCRTDCLGDDCPRRLDRVGMRLGADVEGADFSRVEAARAGEGVAHCLHRHGDGVLVGAGHRFLIKLESPSVGGRVGAPHLGDLLELDPASRNEGAVPASRNEGAVANDAYAHGSSKC